MKNDRSSAKNQGAQQRTNVDSTAGWKGSVRRVLANMLKVLALLVLAAMATGCDNQSKDLFPDKKTIGVPVAGVTHYGTGIEVDEVSLDRFRGGYYQGWGETNAGLCCVLLPRKAPKEPMLVTVRWTTFRVNVKEELRHEAQVPIHFAVNPEDSSGLRIHFLPGHRVELWVTSIETSRHPSYPGPKLEGDPPPYQPLPGELPEPPMSASDAAEASEPVQPINATTLNTHEE